MSTLDGKTAIVTGGGKGIGKGVVKSLLREGAGVCANYNSSASMAEEMLEELKGMGYGDRVFIWQADVSDRLQARAMVEETVKRFGHLDILVNNAAMQTNLPLFASSQEVYENLMRVNLRGYWLMMQECLPYLKEREHSRIICVSSVHGKRPSDFDVVYAMAKGGMKMLVREAAIEFGKYGITVNVILPGGVKIEFKTGKPSGVSFQTGIPQDRKYITHPLGRGGLPSDVGDLAAYIASDLSDHLSGAGIRLDGCSMLL